MITCWSTRKQWSQSNLPWSCSALKMKKAEENNECLHTTGCFFAIAMSEVLLVTSSLPSLSLSAIVATCYPSPTLVTESRNLDPKYQTCLILPRLCYRFVSEQIGNPHTIESSGQVIVSDQPRSGNLPVIVRRAVPNPKLPLLSCSARVGNIFFRRATLT